MMNAPQEFGANPTSTLMREISREWLYDNRIVVFSISSVSRPVVDAYSELMKSTMANWPADQMYLAVYDHSAPGMHVTYYIREKINELAPLYPHLKGYVAIIVSSRLVPLARLIMRITPQKAKQANLFRTREEGIKWLVSKLPQKQANQ